VSGLSEFAALAKERMNKGGEEQIARIKRLLNIPLLLDGKLNQAAVSAFIKLTASIGKCGVVSLSALLKANGIEVSDKAIA